MVVCINISDSFNRYRAWTVRRRNNNKTEIVHTFVIYFLFQRPFRKIIVLFDFHFFSPTVPRAASSVIVFFSFSSLGLIIFSSIADRDVFPSPYPPSVLPTLLLRSRLPNLTAIPRIPRWLKKSKSFNPVQKFVDMFAATRGVPQSLNTQSLPPKVSLFQAGDWKRLLNERYRKPKRSRKIVFFSASTLLHRMYFSHNVIT